MVITGLITAKAKGKQLKTDPNRSILSQIRNITSRITKIFFYLVLNQNYFSMKKLLLVVILVMSLYGTYADIRIDYQEGVYPMAIVLHDDTTYSSMVKDTWYNNKAYWKLITEPGPINEYHYLSYELENNEYVSLFPQGWAVIGCGFVGRWRVIN